MQSHLVCAVSKTYNSDDIDDKKVLSENCDEIDMLTTLIEDSCRHEKSSKTLNKNKNIVQKHIEKKKQYIILKILCCENYINMFKAMKIQNNQKALKFDIILKINSDTLSSQLIIDDRESSFTLKDLFMSDQLIKKIFASKKIIQEN